MYDIWAFDDFWKNYRQLSTDECLVQWPLLEPGEFLLCIFYLDAVCRTVYVCESFEDIGSIHTRFKKTWNWNRGKSLQFWAVPEPAEGFRRIPNLYEPPQYVPDVPMESSSSSYGEHNFLEHSGIGLVCSICGAQMGTEAGNGTCSG